MKITEQTTLAELAAERARLGVIELNIRIGKDGNRVCAAVTEAGGAQRSGVTEAEAIDKVFAYLEETAPPKTAIGPIVDQLCAPGEGGTPVGFYGTRPLPPGGYMVRAFGDPLGERKAVVDDGHEITIPAPTFDDAGDDE